ncbi:FK506-binding protein 4 [Ophiocordyceps camponoti-floridani]|uniref:FK506-binding protein n=1 Tax=Ophiocordyceps camponoti-floridani TaxID=2030778 RepID=A0A8H4Q1A3_9HYPO|nr:FK506-binding protein 4 [Ophiocordyceps camponoti-floridani]
MSAIPGPVYGLEVPPGEVLIPATMDFPASFRITMAALDPTEEPEADEDGVVPSVCRSTLRLVKRPWPGMGLGDDEDDEEIGDEYIKALLAESSDDDDDEPNGGPSDPAKAKEQKQAAAVKKLMEATMDEDEDADMQDAKPNGVKEKGVDKAKGKGKGKAKALAKDEVSEQDSELASDDDVDEGDLENFVVCTLDTERNYQQPLNLSVNHGEKVFFVVTGTHTVHLTGNYVMDDGDDESSDEDDDDYDLSPDELELAMGGDMSGDESDELDGVDHPRITEIEAEDDEEEIPELVKVPVKGKNKRPAPESVGENLDEMMAKSEETKLSKKQQKKLKNNKGEAVAADDNKKDRKVQFAKNLEQGPAGDKGKQGGKDAKLTKSVVQGVTIDDRVVGKGRTVKNGDTVGVRYIGKLANGNQFDANKRGNPFTSKAGKGQVVKGLDVGIMGMAVGGERRMVMPASMGYGSKTQPGIPANSPLTFDIKLLEIK